MLVHASHDAALFPRGEGLALEAVDAVVETPLDEVGVHLEPDASAPPSSEETLNGVPMVWNSHIHKLLHLLLLHAVLQLALFCGGETAMLLAVGVRTKKLGGIRIHGGG